MRNTLATKVTEAIELRLDCCYIFDIYVTLWILHIHNEFSFHQFPWITRRVFREVCRYSVICDETKKRKKNIEICYRNTCYRYAGVLLLLWSPNISFPYPLILCLSQWVSINFIDRLTNEPRVYFVCMRTLKRVKWRKNEQVDGGKRLQS